MGEKYFVNRFLEVAKLRDEDLALLLSLTGGKKDIATMFLAFRKLAPLLRLPQVSRKERNKLNRTLKLAMRSTPTSRSES